MVTWFSKNLGSAMAAQAPSLDISKGYLAYIVVNGECTGAAIFTKIDLISGDVIAYFTPQASTLALQFGATPSEKPIRDRRLSLLAGSRFDWAEHFPE